MNYPHRTYCDVLDDFEKNLKAISIWNLWRVIPVLRSLLEECRIYGHRMEAGLHYTRDLEELHNMRKIARSGLPPMKKL